MLLQEEKIVSFNLFGKYTLIWEVKIAEISDFTRITGGFRTLIRRLRWCPPSIKVSAVTVMALLESDKKKKSFVARNLFTF